MDIKGNSTAEITIILIVIVLILGMIASLSEITTQKISKASEIENIEAKLSEVIDYLINNPGEYNWVKYNKIPGLAIVNENGETIPNSISYSKLNQLGSDYEKYVDEKIFNSKLKSSIELIPEKSTVSSVKIGHDGERGDVYSVNRYVKCDFYNKYVLKNFKNVGKCNHDHDNSSNSCNYFKIFKGNLKMSDYYLLIDEDEKYTAKYFFDTTTDKGNNWKVIDETTICLNDKIDFKNSSEVVFIHFSEKDIKAVLVCVPKNFDKKYLKYDYFRVNDCNLILKAWY